MAGTGFEPVSTVYEAVLEPLQSNPQVENVRLELLLCLPKAACCRLHHVLENGLPYSLSLVLGAYYDKFIRAIKVAVL